MALIYKRECKICGKQFVSGSGRAVYCSPECKHEGWLLYRRGYTKSSEHWKEYNRAYQKRKYWERKGVDPNGEQKENE